MTKPHDGTVGDMEREIRELRGQLREAGEECERLRECACAGCLSASGDPALHTCEDGRAKDRIIALEAERDDLMARANATENKLADACKRYEMARADKAAAEVDRLILRLIRIEGGSEAANLAGAVVERDATIARLTRALAAGPAALREMGSVFLAEHVEAAQEAAMKEGK